MCVWNGDPLGVAEQRFHRLISASDCCAPVSLLDTLNASTHPETLLWIYRGDKSEETGALCLDYGCNDCFSRWIIGLSDYNQ